MPITDNYFSKKNLLPPSTDDYFSKKPATSQRHVAFDKQGSFNSDDKKQRMASPAIIYFPKKSATHILCLSRYPIR
jgi:hypothetical protein